MGRLDNRIALVTGSAGGLGEGIAKALAREGAVVVCGDVGDATAVAESLPVAPDGRRSRAVRLDVTDTPAVEQAVKEIVDDYGSPHIPANKAGGANPILRMLNAPADGTDPACAAKSGG